MVLRAKPEKVEERERTRLALMRATLLLAAKHGFAGLGLREVSRGAEIAPTSFYRHFTDMEELGMALVDELVAPLLGSWLERTLGGLESSRDPAATLVEQARATLVHDRDLMRFVLTERVGAMVSCRLSLRRELQTFATGLERAKLQTSHASRSHIFAAVLTLLLEDLSEGLDRESQAADVDRPDKTEQQLSALLGLRSKKLP